MKTLVKSVCLVPFVAAILLLPACDATPTEWKIPNMIVLTPRLQPMFEKTKTVCFGRFMVDVPASATVAWGTTDLPLGVTIYHEGVDEVKTLARKFIDELKNDKAIYLKNIPLLIAVDEVRQPEGQIVTGYDGFEAIGDLKINGYFRLNNDGIVIDARPLKENRDRATATINSIARRLRQRTETEVPSESGNCIEYAFLPDNPDDDKEHPGEFVSIGFRLKEFPDAHLSIEVRPSNYNDPEAESLKKQWKRIKEEFSTPEEKKFFAATNYFREQARKVHDWHTGYEVLYRSPDEEGVHSHHDFELRFTGVGHDPYKPYADIQFQTGVADNAAGAAKASLTDEEAIAVWDKITSTIRVRPTSAMPVKSADVDPKPRLPLGELAATGRACPQTGWWQATESGNMEAGGRQHIKAGERMPHVVTAGEPSLWQKLKGEQPSYRTATVWKLIGYGDAPAHPETATQPTNVAQAADGQATPNKG